MHSIKQTTSVTAMDPKDLLIQSLLNALENHNGNHVLGNADAKSMNALIESGHAFLKDAKKEQAPDEITEFPSADFTASIVPRFGNTFDCRDALGIRDLKSFGFGDSVLDSTPLGEVNWSELFAYMNRRFGPPHIPSDDQKYLSGAWMLSTPEPDLFLRVLPSLSGAGFSIAPFLSKSSATSTARDDHVVPADRIEGLKAAYRTALVDLLRPVCVRDRHINAMGKVDGESALLDYDEEEDQRIHAADRYVHSGQVIPPGLFGGPEFASLCGMMHHLGGEDIAVGRGLVVQMLRDQVFEEAAQQSIEVKRLMVMSNWNEPHHFQEGLKLTDAELATLLEEAKMMYRTGGHEEGGEQSMALINSVTDEQLALATSFLDRLGMPDKYFRYMIKNARIDGSTQAAFHALGAIVGQDDCPELDCALTVPMTGSDAEIQAHFRDSFEKAQRPDLVAWVDETVARPHGATAFNLLAMHFKRHIEEDQRAKQKEENKRGPKP